MADTRATLRELRRLVRPYRSLLLLAGGCVLVAAGAGLAIPWVSGDLVDAALADDGGSALNRTALLLLGLFVLQALAGGIRSWSVATAGQFTVRDLRVRLFDRVMSLPVAFFDRVATGTVLARLQGDAGAVYGSGAGTGPQTAYAVLSLVGGTVLILLVSPQLGALLLAVLPVAAVVSIMSGRGTRDLSRDYSDEQANATALAADAVAGVRVVKTFRAQDVLSRRFAALTERSVDLGVRRARHRAAWSTVVALLAAVAAVATLWWGGRMIQSGVLSAGELLAVVWYGLMVTRGMTELANQYSRLQQLVGSADRVIDLLDEPIEAEVPMAGPDLRDPDPAAPAVELRRVTFTYPDRRVPAVADLDLVVAPGTTVALVGESGAGKSTIARLLQRHYEPDDGEILLRGRSIAALPLGRVRSESAVVPQDVHLLSGTVADNLRLGRPDATDAELVEAATTARAHGFVTRLPHGYDTVIGERGVRLSGGQQQRLGIARALLVDAPLLILDEATSALDPRGEESVRQALRDLMTGRTNLVIAHRLSTIRGCDRVVVLSGGRIVEDGVPDELMTRHLSRLAALHP
ncbi:MAG: ABC transporter ATP-binding protein [Candidatus Nanopelagicales bacterium]